MALNFENFLQRLYDVTELDSLSDLARVLRVNRSAVSQARKKNTIPATWLLQLYRRFNLNPDWLEKGTGETFLKPSGEFPAAFQSIPKVRARLCAGGGSFEVAADVVGYYSFKQSWLQQKGRAKEMVLMDVFGNSMAPEIKDGDTVLIDQSQKAIIAGAIYALGIEDTIMVKRVERHPRKLVLLSDNKEYAPLYLADEEIGGIRIIGKVLWICRELR